MKKTHTLLLLSLIFTSSAIPLLANAETLTKHGQQVVRTDNYTLASIETKEEQISPLLAVTTIKFGQSIFTLGQAIDELLSGTGYTWLKITEENNGLAELQLPMVQRELGPIRVRDALITVAGVAWELEVNEVNRTLWFTPRLNAYSKTEQTY